MERLQRVGHHLTVPAGVAAEAELPRDVLAPESSAALVDTSGKAINQRFQVSRAEGAKWGDGLRPYFQYRDLGIQRATSDQFRALLLRVREEDSHGGPIEMGQHTTGLHYHDVDFQMVVVVQGWMRFVFEGQGEHRFEAGDAWLQPARITHNELECSDDLIAFEIVTPGVHKTVALDDLAGSPPTAQRFHVSKASEREFKDGLRPYFEYGDPICAWDESNDLLYTRLLAGEQANLDAAYAAHYDSCSPPACTYEELETVVDVLLKTIAVLSPLLSSTMAIAALVYTTTEKDNWDDPDSGLGNFELKERQSDEDDA